MAQKKKRYSKFFIYFSLSIILLMGYLSYLVFKPNTSTFSDGNYLYIPTHSNYESVKKELVNKGFIKNIKSFDKLAQLLHYSDKIHAGKYKLEKGMSNFSIIKLLASGKQTPVRFTFNKIRTQSDFIKLVSSKLEPDSAQWVHLFKDYEYLAQYGLDSNTVMCAIVPDSYDFLWNTSVEKIYKKIAQQYLQFWNKERLNKAKLLSLNPTDVVIIASIVEEETNYKPEKPLVASVYINRLKKGMKLQADPTARFAYGDFNIKRITSTQTSHPSQYNTYYRTGLPPGPICTPSLQTIDAVLAAPTNNYIYFCAKEDFSGKHNFASTLQEHSNNARKYHIALNERGIK